MRHSLSWFAATFPCCGCTWSQHGGSTPSRAEDLIQSFLLNKVLEGKLISKASRERGRFRGFLCTALDRFVANEIRRERAKMRSPEKSVTLDSGLGVADSSPPVDASFDIAWARRLLADALESMRRECDRFNRADIWGVFEARVRPMFGNAEPVPYEQLVERFGFRSPAQASNVLIGAKRMFERVLRGRWGNTKRGMPKSTRKLPICRPSCAVPRLILLATTQTVYRFFIILRRMVRLNVYRLQQQACHTTEHRHASPASAPHVERRRRAPAARRGNAGCTAPTSGTADERRSWREGCDGRTTQPGTLGRLLPRGPS